MLPKAAPEGQLDRRGKPDGEHGHKRNSSRVQPHCGMVGCSIGSQSTEAGLLLAFRILVWATVQSCELSAYRALMRSSMASSRRSGRWSVAHRTRSRR